jgi:hypothetical protein
MNLLKGLTLIVSLPTTLYARRHPELGVDCGLEIEYRRKVPMCQLYHNDPESCAQVLAIQRNDKGKDWWEKRWAYPCVFLEANEDEDLPSACLPFNRCGKKIKTQIVDFVNGTATSDAPTALPTNAPTRLPTRAPTSAPTRAPTETPTEAPTAPPTEAAVVCNDFNNKKKCKKSPGGGCRWNNGKCRMSFNGLVNWCLDNGGKSTCKQNGCGKWKKSLKVCHPGKAKKVKCKNIKNEEQCKRLQCDFTPGIVGKCSGSAF